MTLHDFILKYRTHDVQELLLHAPSDAGDIDLRAAAVQISGWQTARTKLPLWASTEGVLFGEHLNLEQCSSEQSADYKATLVAELLHACYPESEPYLLTDLTGGMGVDSTMMVREVGGKVHLTFVEQNENLCQLARHNLPLLTQTEAYEGKGCNLSIKLGGCQVVCQQAEEVLPLLPHQHLIYLDPARRDRHGARTYALADCSPNVPLLLPLLKEKTDWLLLKLSPMLDVQQALRELGQAETVHVVSIEGECKELLILIRCGSLSEEKISSPNPIHDAAEIKGTVSINDFTPIHCVNITQSHTQSFEFTLAEERTCDCQFADSIEEFLYEPNASVLKAGALHSIAHQYGLRKLAPNSHLYTSGIFIKEFPGRKFRFIEEYNRKKKRAVPLERANITVRNYPLTPDQLRRKLKLRDGGTQTLFATTLVTGQHVLLLCESVM